MTLLTDQAVEVAIDTACRTLRLPTIRERAAHAAEVAAREQHTYTRLPRRTAAGRVR